MAKHIDLLGYIEEISYLCIRKLIKSNLIMGKLLDSLERYFEDTPKDILEKDSEGWDFLNEIGPDVLEYAKIVRDSFDVEISYCSSESIDRRHEYCSKTSKGDIKVSSQYYLAA